MIFKLKGSTNEQRYRIHRHIRRPGRSRPVPILCPILACDDAVEWLLGRCCGICPRSHMAPGMGSQRPVWDLVQDHCDQERLK